VERQRLRTSDTSLVRLLSIVHRLLASVCKILWSSERATIAPETLLTVFTQTVECVVFVREGYGLGFGGAEYPA
jgi:hypothetical protein